MNTDSAVAIFLEELPNTALFRPLKSLASAWLLYPLAERLERRDVRTKIAEIARFYRHSVPERETISRNRLADLLAFAGANVPYYRDLFASLAFDPERIRTDPARLDALPLLTKQIIAEQGDRLLSRPLAGDRTYPCRTGGSTGQSVTIHYDQIAADYSSAVTAYARARIGAGRTRPALHFAARFPGDAPGNWPNRETFKTLAMNRSNIFFDRLDADGIEEILVRLRRRRPYLVHGHPSTLATIAHHLRQSGTPPSATPLFTIFESSGELLQASQRAAIEAAFGCRVVDRYGLAEFGVIAYQMDDVAGRLQLLESECWAESLPHDGRAERLVVTGLRNRLMPLIRYDTGDLAQVTRDKDGVHLTQLLGRIHDVVPIRGVPFLTHHLQDVLDHRVGGVREFQVDLRLDPPGLMIVPEPDADSGAIAARIEGFWPGAFAVRFVEPHQIVRAGGRAKFRHVIDA